MENYNKKVDQELFDHVYKVSKLHRRIGFYEGEIEIFHCLIKDDVPGYTFDFYDENYGYSIYCLYSISERDCKKVNLYEIAQKLANKIEEVTGITVKVNEEINESSPMEYNEFEEKMWHARMVLKGIDDDY